MEPFTFISFVFATGVGVALVVHRLARKSSLDALAAHDPFHDELELFQGDLARRIPWRDRDDLRRYDLRWGTDSVVYQHEERDDKGNIITPEIVYTRYSVIGRAERIPSLRAAAERGGPAFAGLLRDMASIDAFPSPEGLGVAFTDHDIPSGMDPALRFQQLVDTAHARLVGEADTLVYLRQIAREDTAHGASCARLLLRHYPERAAADGLPLTWSGRTLYPDAALAAALALGEPQPLLTLALGHQGDPLRTDIMETAWQAVAAELTPQGFVEAMRSMSPTVFADAARRARAAGAPDVEASIIRIGDRRETHRREAAALLAGFPSSETDATLVAWMAAASVLCAPFAQALRARASAAASPLLVRWLESGDEVDVDTALQWLGDLGAADAVGPLRTLRDRWGTRGARSQRCDAAIAGILARTGAADGALTFVESNDGGLSVAEPG